MGLVGFNIDILSIFCFTISKVS